jgi:hypothetical protein
VSSETLVFSSGEGDLLPFLTLAAANTLALSLSLAALAGRLKRIGGAGEAVLFVSAREHNNEYDFLSFRQNK